MTLPPFHPWWVGAILGGGRSTPPPYLLNGVSTPSPHHTTLGLILRVNHSSVSAFLFSKSQTPKDVYISMNGLVFLLLPCWFLG